MTADRLELDALEAMARKAKEQQYRPVMDAGVVLALIAAARDRDRWHDAAFAGQAHEAQLIAERDAAQAALARVTDDDMAQRIRKVLMQKRLHVNTSGGKQEADAEAVLATIRAVAGEGQEAAHG